MTNIHITVTGASATAEVAGPITAGAVGIPVTFQFDDSWEELQKTAVFRAGDVTVDRIDVDDVTTVPAEITAKTGCTVCIGVYGAAADGSLVIPTVWAEAGVILPGADPSGDESTDPALPVWAELARQTAQLAEQTALLAEQIAELAEADDALAAQDKVLAGQIKLRVRSVEGRTPDHTGNVNLPLTIVQGTFIKDNGEGCGGAIFSCRGEPWIIPQDTRDPILAHFDHQYNPMTGETVTYDLMYRGNIMDEHHTFADSAYGEVFVQTDQTYQSLGKTYTFWEL